MESYSLREALDLQDAPPSTSDEIAEAEAAIAELREDARSGALVLRDETTTKPGNDNDNDNDNAVSIGSSSESDVEVLGMDESNSDDPNQETTTTAAKITPAAAFAASAMKPVQTNLSSRPTPPPTVNRTTATAAPTGNSNSNVAANRKAKKRVPVLHGTLSFEDDWEEGSKRMHRKSVLEGTWRYNDETEAKHDYHTFELAITTYSLNNKTSILSNEPENGTYSGHFGLVYTHVTPKGKRSSKSTKIQEPSVKLEFRKLGKFYRVQGRGSNNLGGDFVLNGTAKPKNDDGTFVVELRKTYLAETSTKPSRKSDGASASLLKSQQQSLYAKATEPPAPLPAPAPQQNSTTAPRAPSPIPSPQQSSSTAPASVKSEEKPLPSPGRIRTTENRRERQDIPTSKRAREINLPPPPPTPEPMTLTQDTAMTMSSTPGGVDRVNGKGMWHAWTRSFDTPLLALLDLFDNAVDASWTLLPDSKQELSDNKPKIRVDLDQRGRNGVVMRNASKFIPNLQQVLQVYKSSKAGDGDNSIGENGIGVKHACASLSGLSFVFTKTTDPSDDSCTIGMGILMQELQRDDGIVLPSVSFPLSEGDSLDEVQEKLEEHCATFPETWGTAVREYGDNHFGDGIDRCLYHMDVLRTHRDWKDSDHVFAVVLANLKHAAFEENKESEAVETIEIDDTTRSSAMTRRSGSVPSHVGSTGTTYHAVHQGGDSDVDEDAQRSMSLLKELKEKLPFLYLHLHDLDVSVDNTPMESIYWERRLAELSKFELQLPQTELWSKIRKERYTHTDEQSVYNITKPEETVRFFCGFDPYRCRSKHTGGDNDDAPVMSYVPGGSMGDGIQPVGNNSAIKVYLYSRQSGRLIKIQNDPRNELGLTAGSTDFSQGLTLIIDDYNGTLPLNPTKQDTAYGHSKHGQIHAANLKEWTAAVAHFYWNYHFARFGSSKVVVTQAVSQTRPLLEEAYNNYRRNQNQHPTVTALCKGTFIFYKYIEFNLYCFQGIQKIRANKIARECARSEVNIHEVVRFDADSEAIAIEKKMLRGRKKRSRPKDSDFQENEVSTHVSSLEMASSAPKRLRSAHHDELELQDRLVLGETIPNGMNNKGSADNNQQAGSGFSHGHNNSQDSNALAIENQQLKHQIQQYHNHNLQLRDNVNKGTHQAMMLQNQCRKLGHERSMDIQKINGLQQQNQQLIEVGSQQAAEANRWKAEAERLRQQVENTAAAPDRARSQLSPSQNNNEIVDLCQDDPPSTAEVGKLKRELKIYKSRSEFYMKEAEAKKNQIENLMQEKSRFEERVQELEASQLGVRDHGGDLLQF